MTTETIETSKPDDAAWHDWAQRQADELSAKFEVGWREIGTVEIESGRLMMHFEGDESMSGVLIDVLGVGDGCYPIEGRYIEAPDGGEVMLNEIRIKRD